MKLYGPTFGPIFFTAAESYIYNISGNGIINKNYFTINPC